MQQKTLDQLRAMARSAGLRGYSGLRKNQLIELLNKHKARPSATVVKRASAPKKSAKSKTIPKVPVQQSDTPATGAAALFSFSFADVANVEERIENAKFETGQRGNVYGVAIASDLHEDIDRLPAANESVLCLLPQKPGVVHAYWVLQHGAPTKQLRLRLCRVANDAIELLDETSIPSERGHWYFHIPEAAEPGSFFAQLGSYDATGKFVSAIRRSIARIPSLYASQRIDRSWWISDKEFSAMYARAGGALRGARLFWPGAGSSSPEK